MSKIIEVIYQDDVLKPIIPIEGLKKNERTWIIICSNPHKTELHKLVETQTHEEAEEMRKTIDEEFESVEGLW